MHPIYTSFTKSAGNHNGSSSHLYSTPHGLDRLSRIFVIVKVEMSIITGSFSPILRKLEAEVSGEHSAIERGASPKTERLTTGATCPAPYGSSISVEPVSCSL
jgi:hypothetical protein